MSKGKFDWTNLARVQDPQEPMKWDCDVFKGKSERKVDVVRGSWKKREIEFRTEHLLGFLKTMFEYLENKNKGVKS